MTTPNRAPIERLLVATDGEPGADAALHVAKLIADRDGTQVEVVGVFSPRIPVPVPHQFERRDRAAVHALRRRIETQLRTRIGVPWRAHLCIGNSSGCIIEAARATRPSLVVLGHSLPSETAEHRPGRHTAEPVTIGCDVPVLVVPPGLNELPRLVVAINDDSAASDRARTTASAILADGGTLRECGEAVGRGLLHHAEALGADLLVLPLHGQRATTRSLMGGSVMDVLDHARCAVLIAPAAA